MTGRSRGVTVGALVIVVLAGAGTAVAFATREDSEASAGDDLPPATAEVTRGTLSDSRSEGGVLGYGTATPVAGRLSGTVTRLPDEGDRVGRGDPLYEVDGRPVPLLYGATPAWRDLATGVEGRDVRQLERNLRALGYDGFEVDDEYTYYTAVTVEEWQEDLGVDETGTVAFGELLFLDGPARVDSISAALGDLVTPGATVVSTTGTAVTASVEVDPSARRLVEIGAKVEVTLPDGASYPARITDAHTEVTEADESQPDSEATTTLVVESELTGKKAQAAAREYDAAAVDVTFTAGERTDVLTVPVEALVALREGGFGVEVVADGTSSYVPVDAGLFSGGRVEITGDGIAEGTVVGVPGD